MTRLHTAGLIMILAVLVLVGCGGKATESATTASVDESARTLEISQAISELGGGGTDFETLWYQSIENVEVHGSSLDIRTSIYPDDEGRAIAKDLCNILNANFVLSNTANYGLETVTVYAQDDPVSYTSPMNGHC